MRDSSTINAQLGSQPLPQGFVQVPVFMQNEVSMSDDLDMDGCDYVQSVDSYRFPSESTYYSVEWLKDDLREPIGNAFNLTEHQRDTMSFMDLYGYCDQI